jgi:Trypsin-like peptidase domain
MQFPTFQPLYERVSRACCYITVFLGDEKISDGTGFAFRSDGQVITAAHVVTGRSPIRKEDYLDPRIRIYAKFVGIPLLEYRVLLCGINVHVQGAFTEPVQLDHALLAPKEPSSQTIPYIPALTHPPALGQEVFLAGYSDELELPFSVARVLSSGFNGAAEFLQAMERGYMADMTGPLIKRGIVGNVRRVVAQDMAANITLECDVFYVDNSVHDGASGGPVFDGSGNAVGVITMRATTSGSQPKYPNLRLPSGATVGLSLQPLELACRRISESLTPNLPFNVDQTA